MPLFLCLSLSGLLSYFELLYLFFPKTVRDSSLVRGFRCEGFLADVPARLGWYRCAGSLASGSIHR
jgi:hypothetical protein